MTNARAWARRREKERKTDEGRGKKYDHRDDANRFAHHDDASRSLARSLDYADAQMKKNDENDENYWCEKKFDFASEIGRSLSLFFKRHFFFHPTNSSVE